LRVTLSDERRELLALLAARKATTPGQLRFWRLNQADPADPAYSWPWALRLPGPVDEPRLRRALDVVLDRHEILTSAYDWDDGSLWQVDAARPQLQVVDTDVQTALREDNRRPFHLGSEPPLRVSLLPDDVLLVNIHNIASDGWSMRVFADELTRACRGEDLPEPALPYHRHAARQRGWLASRRAEQEVAYWRRRLAGLEPRNGRSRESTVERVRIDAGVAEKVRLLGRAAKATPFMAMFALFAKLHGDRTGSHDVAIGTSVSGRAPDAERTIGYFVNRVVLRMNTRGEDLDLVRRARTTAVEAFAHATIPFEHVVERLFPAEYLAAAPLVDVMFVFDTGGAAVVEPEYRTSKFSLVVNVKPDANGYAIEAHHPKGAPHGVLRDYARLLKGLTT
jgi:hypothetical protein